MKKIFLLMLIAGFIVSCKTSKTATTAANTDGISYETAIVIKENTETKGVKAEYDWLKKNYPGYKLIKQSLNNHDSKPYDIMSIKTKDGEKKLIYFDISNFFGKF
jgi:hypothetical protein